MTDTASPEQINRTQALEVSIVDGRIIISIGLYTLAEGASQNDCLHRIDPERMPDGFFRVVNPVKFGYAVVQQLQNGDHIEAALDDAVEQVIELGSYAAAGWDWPAARLTQAPVPSTQD